MCCSRKYPYPSHGRFFSLNPPTTLEIPFWCHTFLQKIGPLKPPSPLEFPLTFLGVGMDIFWNDTIHSIHLCTITIKFRIQFKILLITFKAIHGLAPAYLIELITLRTQCTYNLRYNTIQYNLLINSPTGVFQNQFTYNNGKK